MPILYSTKQYISLVSVDLIAFITVTRIATICIAFPVWLNCSQCQPKKFTQNTVKSQNSYVVWISFSPWASCRCLRNAVVHRFVIHVVVCLWNMAWLYGCMWVCLCTVSLAYTHVGWQTPTRIHYHLWWRNVSSIPNWSIICMWCYQLVLVVTYISVVVAMFTLVAKSTRTASRLG